jgi:hypothetical protein
MLTRLLQEIARAGGSVAVPHLARAFKVNDELVESMIEQLVKLGYLDAPDVDCSPAACHGCPMRHSCSPRPQARLWTLTEKGWQFASERAPSKPPMSS